MHARLQYEDNGGPHAFEMSRDSIVDRPRRDRLSSRRSHRSVGRCIARARAHPPRSRTGAFFIIDLSTLGTTINGQRVPKGTTMADGTKRENGVETPLPTGSRIGLADTVFLSSKSLAAHDLASVGPFFILGLLLLTLALALVWVAAADDE